jgi:hypothetical protein
MKKVAFTIVLNGQPYIEQQAKIIPKIFDKWYIIEGYSLPVKDTAWCKNIDITKFTDNGWSNDGTTEFLDSLSDDNVTVIRKNPGEFWNGKTEMCNSFMDRVENSILMEFDVDEIWKPEILTDVLNYAETNDGFDGMLFKCNYYVGPNLITRGENCYGNKADEWCRLWKVRNKTSWRTHEPPRIHGLHNFLSNDFTQEKGWIFDHYAYALEKQLEFKENYYGYIGAVNNWKRLQNETDFPVNLRDYFPWVNDHSQVIKIK